MTTNTIPPLTRDEKEKAWEARMAKPIAGIAKVGANRWFWVWWPNHHLKYDGQDPHRFGFTDSVKEAIDQCGGIETFTDEDGRIHWRAHYAIEWRSIFAARRRKPNPKAAATTATTEYLYHADGFAHCSAVWGIDNKYPGFHPHRILKKTAKYIFVNEDCMGWIDDHGGVFRVKGQRVNRAEIEANGSSGRYSREFFVVPPENHEEIPDCLATLGLTTASPTIAQVKRAYRLQCRKHHPDVGGDAEAFRNLQEQYGAALALVESRTACVTN